MWESDEGYGQLVPNEAGCLALRRVRIGTPTNCQNKLVSNRASGNANKNARDREKNTPRHPLVVS